MDTNIIGFLIGIVSFVFTIVIFFYQENREKKKITKEAQLLTEEIITQIVRNSTQQKISFLEVNIEYLLNGFTKLRNVSLNCNIADLLRMIYLKIYENDFISKSDKLTIMNEIDFKIIEIQKKNDLILFTGKDRFSNSHWMLRLIKLLIALVTTMIIALTISQTVIFKEINNLKDVINNEFIISALIINIVLIIAKIIVDYYIKLHNKKSYKDYSIKYDDIMSIYSNDVMKKECDEKYAEDITEEALNENCIETSKKKPEEAIIDTAGTTKEEPSDEKVTTKVTDDTTEETTNVNSGKYGIFTKRDNRTTLGEIVILRMEIEYRLSVMSKNHLKDNNDKRIEPIYILKKLMSVIEQSQKLNDSQKEKAVEGYTGIRRCYMRLSDILHYNNSYYLPNEKGLNNFKNEIDSNLNLLTDILNTL